MMRKTALSATSAGGVSAVCAIAFLVSHQAAPVGPVGTVRTGAFVETLSERGAVSSARLSLYGSTIAACRSRSSTRS